MPHEDALGQRVGAMLSKMLREHDVSFYSESRVQAFRGNAVELEDGEVLPADALLVALGSEPRSAFLLGVPRRAADGAVEVDLS